MHAPLPCYNPLRPMLLRDCMPLYEVEVNMNRMVRYGVIERLASPVSKVYHLENPRPDPKQYIFSERPISLAKLHRLSLEGYTLREIVEPIERA